MKRELPNGVYRVDAQGQVTLVVTEEQVPDPNGLTFSPDYKQLYVVSTGRGPGDTGPGGEASCSRSTSTANNTLSNQKLFTDFMIDGVKARADGVRCDVFGNVWCSSNAGRAVGYNGVTAWTPEGKLLGPHSLARGVRQSVLWRSQAQSSVHGREPIALCGLRQHARILIEAP